VGAKDLDSESDSESESESESASSDDDVHIVASKTSCTAAVKTPASAAKVDLSIRDVSPSSDEYVESE
jgi:hypothetical protein